MQQAKSVETQPQDLVRNRDSLRLTWFSKPNPVDTISTLINT